MVFYMSFGMYMWFLLATVIYLAASILEDGVVLTVSAYLANIFIRLFALSFVFVVVTSMMSPSNTESDALDVDLAVLTKEYEKYTPTEESSYTLKETSEGVEVVYALADGKTSDDKNVDIKKEKIQAQIAIIKKRTNVLFRDLLISKYLLFVYYNVFLIVIEFLIYLKVIYKPKRLEESKKALRN